MEALTIDVTRQAELVRIKVTGELDEDTANRMRAIDLGDLAGTGCRDLVLDLGDLEFMDSSGIGSLVNLRNRAAAEQMTITLDLTPVHIRHTLTVAGLAGLFGLKP